jgi:hypothetical protein
MAQAVLIKSGNRTQVYLTNHFFPLSQWAHFDLRRPEARDRVLGQSSKMGNPVEGERDSGLKLNAIPL